jgi:flagellar biosynthesis chaperone FliJ
MKNQSKNELRGKKKNVVNQLKKKKILKANYITNIKKLKEYKLIPEKMLSVIPEKKIEVDTVENLINYLEILQKRIKKAENTIDNFEDEQEDHIIGLNNILNDVCDDKEKVCKIKKQLANMVDKHKLYNMTEIELIMEKDKMLMEMKIEYENELLKIYKQYNNIAMCIKKKKILKATYITNIKKLKEYKLIPEKMLSVIPEKKIEIDTVENLMNYLENLHKRIKKAENTIDNFEDEQEDYIIGLNNILNDVCDDKEKVCKIKKQLANMVDKHKLYNMTK